MAAWLRNGGAGSCVVCRGSTCDCDDVGFLRRLLAALALYRALALIVWVGRGRALQLRQRIEDAVVPVAPVAAVVPRTSGAVVESLCALGGRAPDVPMPLHNKGLACSIISPSSA
jgi:hypothetical protein